MKRTLALAALLALAASCSDPAGEHINVKDKDAVTVSVRVGDHGWLKREGVWTSRSGHRPADPEAVAAIEALIQSRID